MLARLVLPVDCSLYQPLQAARSCAIGAGRLPRHVVFLRASNREACSDKTGKTSGGIAMHSAKA